MSQEKIKALITYSVLILFAGCASVPEDGNFSSVQIPVKEKSGLDVRFNSAQSKDDKVDFKVKELLHYPLTSNSAAQIALLNNPSLQSKFSKLGVASAELVQAGLLMNPTLGGLVLIPEKSGKASLSFDIAFNLLNLLLLPLKTSVAQSEYEEVSLEIQKSCLNLIAETHSAFYEAIAAQQLESIAGQKLEVSKASFNASQALREAGNISELDLSMAESFFLMSEIEYLEIKENARIAKLRLYELLGIDEKDYLLKLPTKLNQPDVQFSNDLNLFIQQAIASSIDLSIIRQRLETTSRRYNIVNVKALIPELHLGGEAEQEDGHWKYGPSLEFALPIFDQGQAQKAKAKFIIKGLQEEYVSTTIRIRSTAQMLNENMKRISTQYKQIKMRLRPISEKALRLSVLQYNAMQKGVFDLLNIRQQQYDIEMKLIDTLKEYWVTHVKAQQLKYGVLTDVTIKRSGMNTLLNREASGGDH